MADPVQVLVTIHPDDPDADTNWRTAVMGALLRDGQLIAEANYSCETVIPGVPRGGTKAHREAAERALEDSDMMSRHDDGWWQHRAMQAVAHALLALGERP